MRSRPGDGGASRRVGDGVELRYIDLKAGRHLQLTEYDDTQAHTSNHADPRAVVDDLLGEPFGNWHVETTEQTLQLRVTKKGEAVLHAGKPTGATPERGHDRAKERLLDPADPVLRALDISDGDGRVKPSRQAKYRQVEEFLRALGATLDDAATAGRLRTPTEAEPLRVVDLGCGNAYLTFAAYAWLRARDWPVRLTGVDVKQQSYTHNTEVAERLAIGDSVEFVVGGIADAEPYAGTTAPDVVLALHACDTATDDALARAVGWQAPVILAAPCCHHDISAQLRRQPTPPGYSMLTRDGILRERFADTLTDSLRATLMRLHGYRVDVVDFVDSAHTPRNTLLRAIRTGASPVQLRGQYDELVGTWRVEPRLEALLGRGDDG